MRTQTNDKALQRKLRTETFTGYDIVPDVVRLAAMNMYLHGIGETESPAHEQDYRAGESRERTESERFRPFAYDELVKRDRLNLDIFWLKDESLEGREPGSNLLSCDFNGLWRT